MDLIAGAMFIAIAVPIVFLVMCLMRIQKDDYRDMHEDDCK